MSLRALLRRTKEGVATVLQVVLGVGDNKLWQVLDRVVDDVDDAVVGAGPRPQGLVRLALHAVKLLPELLLHGPKTLPLPHIRGLERVRTVRLSAPDVVGLLHHDACARSNGIRTRFARAVPRISCRHVLVRCVVGARF